MLTREEIASKQDLKIETVHVPEWGGDLLVKELPAGVAQEFWDGMNAERQGGTIPKYAREKLIVKSVVDENGDPIFTDDDVEMLAGKSNLAINAVFEVAIGLSGISDTAVEEAAKNSESGPTD